MSRDSAPTSGTVESVDHAVIEVWTDPWVPHSYTVTLSILNDAGAGTGYRISGPKTSETSRRVHRRELTERDANEIRAILDGQFPRPGRGDDGA